MGILKRIWAYARVFSTARRNRTDLLRWFVRRPQLLVAQGTYESSLLLMGRLSADLKVLAVAKAAMIVNCEYCLDIGAAVARAKGIPEAKLVALLEPDGNPALTEDEQLVVAFSAAISASPALVPDELKARVNARFNRAQVAELAAEIAWENQRARLNQALGVRPAGFSDGSFCLIPEAARQA